jgi:hypothetical protein
VWGQILGKACGILITNVIDFESLFNQYSVSGWIPNNVAAPCSFEKSDSVMHIQGVAIYRNKAIGNSVVFGRATSWSLIKCSERTKKAQQENSDMSNSPRLVMY